MQQTCGPLINPSLSPYIQQVSEHMHERERYSVQLFCNLQKKKRRNHLHLAPLSTHPLDPIDTLKGQWQQR